MNFNEIGIFSWYFIIMMFCVFPIKSWVVMHMSDDRKNNDDMQKEIDGYFGEKNAFIITWGIACLIYPLVMLSIIFELLEHLTNKTKGR